MCNIVYCTQFASKSDTLAIWINGPLLLGTDVVQLSGVHCTKIGLNGKVNAFFLYLRKQVVVLLHLEVSHLCSQVTLSPNWCCRHIFSLLNNLKQGNPWHHATTLYAVQ